MLPVIEDEVENDVTVLFVDFQSDAKILASNLTDNGVQARYLVGGSMDATEKQIAADSFRDGVDKVLVATETYECGMHNANTSKVMLFGVPRNLSMVVQEMGRTGRSGEGTFKLYYNEFHDDQRLSKWIGCQKSNHPVDMKSPDVLETIADFVVSWRFVYSSIMGICIHHALTYFYNDPAELDVDPVDGRKKINLPNCLCTNCRNRYSYQSALGEVCDTVRTLNYLTKKNFEVTTVHLAEFLLGSSTKWNKKVLGVAEYDEFFGAAQKWKESNLKFVTDVIRVCICVGFIELSFQLIYVQNNSPRMMRRLV